MKNKGMELAVKTVKTVVIGAMAVVPVVVTVAKRGVKETVKIIFK